MLEETYANQIKAELLDIVQHNPIIYKYLSFETGVLAITNLSVGFKSPWAFNDPYDFFEGLICFENVPDGYREYLVDKYHPGFSEAEKKAKLAEFASVSDSVAIEYVKKNGMFNEVKNRGVSCFSRKYDHMLMWSHYAQSHRGICIGFNMLQLYINVARYSGERMIALVNYVEEMEPVDYYYSNGEAILRWMKTKAAVWSYEEEIRIILNGLDYQGQENFIVNLDSDCFNSIYYGSMISNENRTLLDILTAEKMPNVEIFQMERQSNSFLLKASPIRD